MQEKRSLADSPMHKQMISEGLVLTKTTYSKHEAKFAWESENFFRYEARDKSNKITVIYIPKEFWGKREVELYTHELQYSSPLQFVLDEVGMTPEELVAALKKLAKSPARPRKRTTAKRKR